MTKLEIAKKIIKDNYDEGNCGLFDTRNMVGDHMTNLYNKNGLRIDICYQWSYFEVFGLDNDEIEKLLLFYDSLS